MKMLDQIADLNRIAEGKVQAERLKTRLQFAHAQLCQINQAFDGVESEEDRINFCLELIRLWLDKDCKEEARRILCQSGNLSDKRFEFQGNHFWGMTLTTLGWINRDTDELRLWVGEPGIIRPRHVGCGGGGFPFLDIRGELAVLKKYWRAIIDAGISYNPNLTVSSELGNGVWLYTSWIQGGR